MKAKLVNEEINFERTGDSKKSLNIGKYSDVNQIRLAKKGLIIVPEGEYEIYMSYFTGNYRAEKNTGETMYIKEQEGLWKLPGTGMSDNEERYSWAIPEELKEKNDKYKRRSPDGGGFYAILVPRPEGNIWISHKYPKYKK